MGAVRRLKQGSTCAVAVLLLAFAASAQAASYTVNTTADNAPATGECSGAAGDCSLRQAIDKATSGSDTISVPAGHYTLTSHTPLVITAAVTINGAGARTTTIDGDNAEQVFRGNRDTSGCGDTCNPPFALSDMTITGGHAQSADAPDYNEGGGIISWGGLTLTNVHLTGNTAENDAGKCGDGGGLDAQYGLTIINSTIDNNSACGDGGGIRAQYGNVTITNTTIANNTAQDRSAMDLYSGATGTVTITNSTIANNTGSAAYGYAVENGSGSHYTVVFQNTVLANDLTNNKSNCLNNGLSSGGGNLATDGTCALTGTGDQPNASAPGLGALADNGGSTDTMMPQSKSPLIDAALNANCPPADQRGISRPLDGNGDGTATCDIGAVEAPALGASHTLTVAVSGGGSVSGNGISCPGTCTASIPDGTQVTLTASPGAGETFSGWGGDCSGTGVCSFTMGADHTISATFATAATQQQAGGDSSAPPAPDCSVKPSPKVALRKAGKGRHRGKVPTASVAVLVTCDQAVTGKLSAVVTDTPHGKKKSKRFKLPAVSVSLAPGVSKTVSFKLNAAALKDLQHKAVESIAATLTGSGGGGAVTTSATVSALKL